MFSVGEKKILAYLIIYFLKKINKLSHKVSSASLQNAADLFQGTVLVLYTQIKWEHTKC